MIYIDIAGDTAAHFFGAEYYYATEASLQDDAVMLWRTKPTVMLGKYQNAYAEVNTAYTKAHGIDIVRRYSGGGAIFTDGGAVQYSYITRNAAAGIELERFTVPVARALQKMGAQAAISGRNDITVNGTKVAGNAQYRVRGALVHHGSLLFDSDIEQLARSLNVSEHKLMSKGIKSVRERVLNLSTVLNDIQVEEFMSCIRGELMQGAKESIVPSAHDTDRIRELSRTLFTGDNVVFGTLREFDVVRKHRFNCGTICVSLEVKDGIIQSAAVTGDFFAASTDAAEKLEAALIAAEFTKPAIFAALRTAHISELLFDVSAEDIAAMFD